MAAMAHLEMETGPGRATKASAPPTSRERARTERSIVSVGGRTAVVKNTSSALVLDGTCYHELSKSSTLGFLATWPRGAIRSSRHDMLSVAVEGALALSTPPTVCMKHLGARVTYLHRVGIMADEMVPSQAALLDSSWLSRRQGAWPWWPTGGVGRPGPWAGGSCTPGTTARWPGRLGAATLRRLRRRRSRPHPHVADHPQCNGWIPQHARWRTTHHQMTRSLTRHARAPRVTPPLRPPRVATNRPTASSSACP